MTCAEENCNREVWAAGLCSRCYNAKRTGYRHERRVQKVYGLRPGQYQEMLDAQGSACAICREECSRGYRLAVDHCHDTGQVRGLLCSNCNTNLGKWNDDPELLQAALSYLLRFET